jgi:hypothetical protein
MMANRTPACAIAPEPPAVNHIPLAVALDRPDRSEPFGHGGANLHLGKIEAGLA